MSELSREARAILEAAAGADDPSLADKGRVHEALMAKLNAPPPATAAAAQATAAAAGSSTLVKIVIGLALIGAVSVGAYLVVGGAGDPEPIAKLPAPAPAELTPAAEITPPPAMDPPAVAPAPDPEPAATPEPAAMPEPAPTKRPRKPHMQTLESLVAEKRIISAARRALASGDAATALELSEKHRREFPRGQLRAERNGTRVLALCELGRTDEAASDGRRFLRRYSKHPMAGRVRTSCATGN